MLALAPTLLALIAEIAPLLGAGSQIGKAVSLVAQIVPPLIQTAKDMIPVAKSAIAALRGNAEITPEQIAELDAIEAKIDADYDAASAAAKAEDEAAGGTPAG